MALQSLWGFIHTYAHFSFFFPGDTRGLLKAKCNCEAPGNLVHTCTTYIQTFCCFFQTDMIGFPKPLGNWPPPGSIHSKLFCWKFHEMSRSALKLVSTNHPSSSGLVSGH